MLHCFPLDKHVHTVMPGEYTQLYLQIGDALNLRVTGQIKILLCLKDTLCNSHCHTSTNQHLLLHVHTNAFEGQLA